jgi:hypothetical protein
MVLLEFTIQVAASLKPVWDYFSRFEAITEWDPNTKGCKPLKKVPGEIGSTYEVTTVFNGSESVVEYTATDYKELSKIALNGHNKQITAIDEILFREVGPNRTEVTYRADITLNGVLWLFTPFIKGSLKDLEENAKKGMLKKSEEMFGKAN